MKNPFCISFGRPPVNYIDRTVDKTHVIETFTLDPVTDQLFLITGVRGSGKTVFMNTIANTLEAEKDWVVLRESSESDIVNDIYSDLYRILNPHSSELQQLSVSVAGTGISVTKKEPPANVITLIDDLLERLEKKGKKVLVTIDEVTNTSQMKRFSHMFQIECSRARQIYFLGTGLYENIRLLSDGKDMTFLHRAPKIVLAPLNKSSVAGSYSDIFGISRERSMVMADYVQGYSFAFQALGYTFWEHGCPDDIKEVLPDYDVLLSDASYSKIWAECSKNDQLMLKAMAECDSENVTDIRRICGDVPPNYFSVYRDRLIKKGIVVSPARGSLKFALPRFKEFILNHPGE
ncbi:MAG: AAA family ATPase [Eubacterium sp.]|jgi:tRNA A37 threonylcarbamoyladenosine biosynthesis protein TsaE